MVIKHIEKAKSAAHHLKKETQKQLSIAITSAFALLIALAWKDVISEYIKKVTTKLAISGPAPMIQLYSALITTIICVVGIVISSKWANKKS